MKQKSESKYLAKPWKHQKFSVRQNLTELPNNGNIACEKINETKPSKTKSEIVNCESLAQRHFLSFFPFFEIIKSLATKSCQPCFPFIVKIL